MRFFSGVKRAEQVVGDVRSAGMQLIVVVVVSDLGEMGGGGGSTMSVSVMEAHLPSFTRAAVSACPMKPPAPVMRMFIGFESWKEWGGVWLVVGGLQLTWF